MLAFLQSLNEMLDRPVARQGQLSQRQFDCHSAADNDRTIAPAPTLSGAAPDDVAPETAKSGHVAEQTRQAVATAEPKARAVTRCPAAHR